MTRQSSIFAPENRKLKTDKLKTKHRLCALKKPCHEAELFYIYDTQYVIQLKIEANILLNESNKFKNPLRKLELIPPTSLVMLSQCAT